MKWWDQMPWSLFSKCWAFSQLFHSPLSLGSRGVLVTLHSLPEGWCHIWGYWYFSLQSWFQLASISPVFLMMYSAQKLNKQGDNIQPWRTPFPIWNQSVVPCPVLTVASWPAYMFLKRQVVQYSHLFQNFPQFIVIHTIKGFGIVNKAEIDVFLKLLLFWWSSRCWKFDLWFLCLF